MDVRRFYKSDNWMARLQGQFLASLFGQQCGKRETAIQFDTHVGAFAGHRLDDGGQMISGAGRTVLLCKQDDILGANANVNLAGGRRQRMRHGGEHGRADRHTHKPVSRLHDAPWLDGLDSEQAGHCKAWQAG